MKLHTKIFWFMTYKSLTDTKPICIMFDKVERFIWDLDGTNYLVLFGLKKYDAIYDRIRYLMGLKSGITFFFSYNYPKI